MTLFSQKYMLLMFLCFLSFQFAYAQQTEAVKVSGVVIDKTTGETLPGANLILQSNVLQGVTSDANGRFSIEMSREQVANDSLIVSFIGYNERIVAVRHIMETEKILLSQKAMVLNEATVKARRIIAEEFTIKQMKQIEIYLNPMSKADPLLAVNAMPAATTTDESASISLRGSSPEQTGVFFNGVPVYDAVRFSQLNGIGTFSIFNTAIVERMHVFPSNPPLEYGNTSSGLISIQSKNSLPVQNKHSISLSLANMGGLMVRKFGKKTALTIFSNYQPSAALIGVNEQAFDNLKKFYSGDAGVHLQFQPSKKTHIKLFNYTNMEGYSYGFEHASFSGDFDMEKRRNFSIANFTREFSSGELTVNGGASFSLESYDYGNTFIDLEKNDYFASISYHHFWNKFSFKAGFSNDSRWQKNRGTVPIYKFALDTGHPNIDIDDVNSFDLTEAFVYGKYEFTKKWITGGGVRKNLAYNEQADFLSAQWNLHYKFTDHHSINTSLGRYHRCALPNAQRIEKTFYRSDQVSVDYRYEKSKMEITAAVFAKETNYEQIRESIQGAEIFAKLYLFNNRVQLQSSYTFINAIKDQDTVHFSGKYDLDYYIRSSLKYQHKRNLDISLIMLYRQGTLYQPVTSAFYIDQIDVYAPQYADEEDRKRFPDYLKIDLSLSKMWILSPKLSIIAFINVNNLFDNKNVRDVVYSKDYSKTHYAYYSRRTIYFGGIINF